MISIYKKQSNIFRKNLGIKDIVSIRFSNSKPQDCERYKDTACTALARGLRGKTGTYLDRQEQLCPGGNYFLNKSDCSLEELRNTYVKEEKVFENNSVCDTFIKNLPEYPNTAKKRYITITPFAKEGECPEVAIFLANPAQAGRILGLATYDGFSSPIIMPAISTCASIYAPLETHNLHINFIDYYDRYYQGLQGKKSIWKESELIISMSYEIFERIIRNIPLSPHGIYKPKIKPKKFSKIDI